MTSSVHGFRTRWAASARKQAFAEVGKPFEVLWWLTRPGFERRQRRAFRYLGAA